jgi:hypothetical protein
MHIIKVQFTTNDFHPRRAARCYYMVQDPHKFVSMGA